MRVRVFFQTLIAALVLWALAPPAASAQTPPMPQRQQFDSRPLQVLRVVLGTQPPVTMELRYHFGRSGYVVGVFQGDRIAGYQYVNAGQPNVTTDDQHTLALVRYDSANTAVQVFTADYNTTQRAWIGLVHGLDGASTSATQTAVGFRTVPFVPVRCSRLSRVPCPPPLEPPPAPHATTPYDWSDAAIGFGIDANSFLGALVLRSDPAAPGAFSGHALADPISGRYAPGAGTIAFLRSDSSNTPVQVWHGVFEQGGAKSGRGYPLGPNGGGPFRWRVTHDEHAVVGLRSSTGGSRCLTHGPAFTSSCAREWLLFAVGRTTGSNPRTMFSLAHVTGGLCLDVPNVPDGLIVERPCLARGANAVGAGQALSISNWLVADDGELDFANGVDSIADFDQSSNLRFATGAGFGRCLAVQGSTGDITAGECDSDRANWARLL